jgi:hypothetical protein
MKVFNNSVFNISGSLKVSNTGSVGGSALTVRVSGTFGSMSASNVTSITFSGSFLTASSPNSSNMTVQYSPNAPIMYISGFRGSATPSERNLYLVTSSGFFSGSETFMCTALYMEAHHATRTHLAGVSIGPGVANCWTLETVGDLYGDAGRGGSFIDGYQLTRAGGNPYCGKWHVITLIKVGLDYQIFLDGGGGGQFTTIPIEPAWTTAVSFSIGVPNGGDLAGDCPGFVSAVAIKTASFVPQDAKIIGELHSRIIRDGDIRQGSIGNENWNHIWSVKQNTPGATWRDAVGVMHLNRSGTLSILTESNPRWA